MRIKLDENLPQRLAAILAQLGHDTSTAIDEGLTGCTDREIWEAAQQETRFLITQDLDFSDTRQFYPWITFRNSSDPAQLAEPAEPNRTSREHFSD
jgi:predicted nuclease of predicted toxin-antitoxin system